MEVLQARNALAEMQQALLRLEEDLHEEREAIGLATRFGGLQGSMGGGANV